MKLVSTFLSGSLNETLQRSKNAVGSHSFDSPTNTTLRRTSLGTSEELLSRDLPTHKRQPSRPTELVSSSSNEPSSLIQTGSTGSGGGGSGHDPYHVRRSSLLGQQTGSSTISGTTSGNNPPPLTYPKPSSALSSSYAVTSASKDLGTIGRAGISVPVTTTMTTSSHLTNGPNALYATVNTNHRIASKSTASSTHTAGSQLSSSQFASNKKSVGWANQLANGSMFNSNERQSKSILSSFDSPTDSYGKDKKFDDWLNQSNHDHHTHIAYDLFFLFHAFELCF